MAFLLSHLWDLAAGCFLPFQRFPDRKTSGHCRDLSQLLEALWDVPPSLAGAAGARVFPSPRMSHILQGQITGIGSGQVPSQRCWKMNMACEVLQGTLQGESVYVGEWKNHKGEAGRTLNGLEKWVGDREELKPLFTCVLGSWSIERVFFSVGLVPNGFSWYFFAVYDCTWSWTAWMFSKGLMQTDIDILVEFRNTVCIYGCHFNAVECTRNTIWNTIWNYSGPTEDYRYVSVCVWYICM